MPKLPPSFLCNKLEEMIAVSSWLQDNRKIEIFENGSIQRNCTGLSWWNTLAQMHHWDLLTLLFSFTQATDITLCFWHFYCFSYNSVASSLQAPMQKKMDEFFSFLSFKYLQAVFPLNHYRKKYRGNDSSVSLIERIIYFLPGSMLSTFTLTVNGAVQCLQRIQLWAITWS